jgi:lactoylglutathione lyase
MLPSTIASDIDGIYETHLPVRDLSRSITFYRDKLGLELATEIAQRQTAFFWVGGKENGMLGLWQTGSGPFQTQLHFAFRTRKEAVLAGCERLKLAGIEPLGFRGEPVDEPVVIGWLPAIALYFKDPDGHSLEMIHVLTEAPDPDFGVGSLSKWIATGHQTGETRLDLSPPSP